jgi:hypothetical protein
VLSAIKNAESLTRERLHQEELGIAFISYQIAEYTRDRKVRRKPYKPEEFYCFASADDTNLPEPRYGAAAIKLAELGEFPTWALFAFVDLKKRGKDALPPELLCLRCEDAIILAPNIEGSKVTGMLIALKSASNQIREMEATGGATIMIRLPKIEDKVVAIEEPELRALV